MWTISGKIQLHGIGINRAAPARAMLLHARDNLSSPCRIGRRSRLARHCTNRRRKRLLVSSKIGSKDLVIRLYGQPGLRCSCECERKETPYRREGKSWAGSEIFARSGKHAGWVRFCFYKTCRDNLPRLAFYGMRSQHKFVITAGLLCHLFVTAPLVTSQALADQSAQNPAAPPEQARQLPRPLPAELRIKMLRPPKHAIGNCHSVITSQPAVTQPASSTAPAQSQGTSFYDGSRQQESTSCQSAKRQPVIIDARECETGGQGLHATRRRADSVRGLYFHGDLVTYDSASGDVTAKGHVSLDGGRRDMHISGSEGTYNLHSQTGKFYDVRGSTGSAIQRAEALRSPRPAPFRFPARWWSRPAPDEYVLHHGSVTSCELPRPKWTFNAAKIILRVGSSAHVYNTTFRLKGVPVFYLPYASPPVERLGRESGFLIPNFGTSNTKGTVVGDSFYWAINRSMDATLGGEYLSKRGWALQENFRYRPSEASFLNLNYFGVLDRGITTTSVNSDPENLSRKHEAGRRRCKAQRRNHVRP